MPASATVHPAIPPTVWLARGRHPGPDAPDVVRDTLRRRGQHQVIDDHLELPDGQNASQHVFEARWKAAGTVTVRARLTLARDTADGQEWVLAAEAEAPWDPEWPSPATVFWPDAPDADWDHDPATGLRLGGVNRLPPDDKDIRRLLRASVRDGWSIDVVVHEAMTPDEHGRRPLAPLLPPSLRQRVLEHRAAPEQLRVVNWALREFHVEVPRGGAVLLPPFPAPDGFDAGDFAVRTVFLDGSRPTELIDALTRFAALPPPLPQGGEEALTALREDWHLRTPEEELVHQRKLVAMYAEALEAMTKSRDLYREAAERAHEALAVYRESAGDLPARPDPSTAPARSPLRQLTRTFERLKVTAARVPRPASDTPDGGRDDDGDAPSRTAEP
ncbi:hypothetical protein [Streptomyces sp. NPDC020996]|uniref:hypothetical protein n=1 Tax=Streptomyces sp. NPDC020996 TaxID=3154791 RepID=UPI0033C4C01D